MAAAHGIIRFHQQGRTVTFRVEGRAIMTQSLPLRRQADRSLQGGATHFRIDLRDCAHMDSTFLGTLLALKKSLEREGRGPLTLLAPSESCQRILQQMGLSEVLLTEPADGQPEPAWTLLPCDMDDLSSFRRNVVQAHEELATLPGAAGQQFQTIVQCMNQNTPAPKDSSGEE